MGKQNRTPKSKEQEEIDKWDTMNTARDTTMQKLVAFEARWKETPDKSKPQPKCNIGEVIEIIKAMPMLFSHEMNEDYFGYAIAQGHLSSGFRVSKALGCDHASHDGGKAHHDFFFTRVLPLIKSKVMTNLSFGQVGSSQNFMIILSPTMFEDPEQQVFLKTFDGGHRNSNILPPKALRSSHIKFQCEQIAKSKDSIFYASQEQGIRGFVKLKHIEFLILKCEDHVDLTRRKATFIALLRNTKAASILPPPHARSAIQKKIYSYDAWKAHEGQISLYDLLEAGINDGVSIGPRRKVEDIVFAKRKTTPRAHLYRLLTDDSKKKLSGGDALLVPEPAPVYTVDGINYEIEYNPPGDGECGINILNQITGENWNRQGWVDWINSNNTSLLCLPRLRRGLWLSNDEIKYLLELHIKTHTINLNILLYSPGYTAFQPMISNVGAQTYIIGLVPYNVADNANHWVLLRRQS